MRPTFANRFTLEAITPLRRRAMRSLRYLRLLQRSRHDVLEALESSLSLKRCSECQKRKDVWQKYFHSSGSKATRLSRFETSGRLSYASAGGTCWIICRIISTGTSSKVAIVSRRRLVGSYRGARGDLEGCYSHEQCGCIECSYDQSPDRENECVWSTLAVCDGRNWTSFWA